MDDQLGNKNEIGQRHQGTQSIPPQVPCGHRRPQPTKEEPVIDRAHTISTDRSIELEFDAEPLTLTIRHSMHPEDYLGGPVELTLRYGETLELHNFLRAALGLTSYGIDG